jgi:oxygen-dependent protoporphyrinogen oxidase
LSVLVVGGGIAGLVAARDLARAGIPVTLVEAGPRLGGKVATEHVDGLVIEHGPDAILVAKPAALALVRDLGLEGELVQPKEPRRVAIRRGDALVPLPDGVGLVLPTRLMPFVRTRLFSWPEKVRMARDLVAPRMLPDGDVAVGAFLRRRVGDVLVDRLAAPLVGGIHGTPIDELSLDAAVPQLRVAERDHRSLLLAGLAEGRARRSGGPPFVAFREGMRTLVDGLVRSLEAAGARVCLGTAATSLDRDGAGVGVTAHLGDGTSARFDAAILATPAPVAALLLATALPAATSALETIPHGRAIVVTLAYRRDAIHRPPFGHGHLVPVGEGSPVSACTWSSEKWPHRAPDDVLLARAFLRDSPSIAGLADPDLIALARAEVERVLRIDREPLLVRVARHEGDMARYTVGHLDRVAAIEAALEGWPAVTVAGGSYRGGGLPDVVAQGSAAAAGVLARA